MDMIYSLLIYTFTFALSIFFMWRSEKSKTFRYVNVLLAILIPAVTAMYRECGIDFWTYKGLYYGIQSSGWGYTEWLWNVLNVLSPTYEILLFISAFIFLSVSYAAVNQLVDKDKALSWFIILTIPYITFYNGMRQMLAVAFVFYAITLMFKRQYVKCFLFAVLGGGFHKTAYFAMLFLVLFYIVIRRKRHYTTLIVLVSAAFIVGTPVIVALVKKLGVYESYATINEGFGSVSFLLYLLPPLIFFYCRRNFFAERQINWCMAFYLLSIAFQFLGNRITYVDRFMWYTQIFISVLAPMIIHEYDKQYSKHSLRPIYYAWFTFSYVIIAVVMNGQGTYPYRVF